MGQQQLTQAKRLLCIDTSLGKDVLILQSLRGKEGISSIYNFKLGMLSYNCNLEPKDIVGKQGSISIGYGDRAKPRWLHGLFNTFTAGKCIGDLRYYEAELVPKLWLLTKITNCRIFQKKSIVDIIKEIFKDAQINDYSIANLNNNYEKREYCVQYKETAFDFISRLMEEEGVFYFFLHEQDKHTLVLADHNAAFKDNVVSEIDHKTALDTTNSINNWQHKYQLCSGKFAQSDYDFLSPSNNLLTTSSGINLYTNASQCEQFHYPGNYNNKNTGNKQTKIKIEAEEMLQNCVYSEGKSYHFVPGTKFKLSNYTAKAENDNYIILEVYHEAQDLTHQDGDREPPFYKNNFTCLPTKITYRTPMLTNKPVIPGMQSAIVVGSSADEIDTDRLGRVKVQFFWDREGKKDENSSCWVRVAQHLADNKWGCIYIPRIGQEVLVSFFEGDVDKPVIVGALYNNERMPPYDLPANKTQLGIKTHSSSKGGATDANELRFEDQKGKEHIYLHAQKDHQIVVENDKTMTIKHDCKITVKNNRQCTIEEGNETICLKQGNSEYNIEKGDLTLHVAKGSAAIKVDQGNLSYSIGQGNRKAEIGGNDSIAIKHGNYSVKADLGKVTIESLQGIELKVGSNSIKIDQTGIQLNGMMIKIAGQAMVQVNASGMLQLKGAITMIN